MKTLLSSLLLFTSLQAMAGLECSGRVQKVTTITEKSLVLVHENQDERHYMVEHTDMTFRATHYLATNKLFLEIDHKEFILATHLFEKLTDLTHSLTAVDRTIAGQLICQLK